MLVPPEPPVVYAAAGGGAPASGFEEVELTPIDDVEKGAAKGEAAARADADPSRKTPSGVSVESARQRRLILPDI